MAQGRKELTYGLTFQNVVEILRLVDSGSFEQLHLEVDGLDLDVLRRLSGATLSDPQQAHAVVLTRVAEPEVVAVSAKPDGAASEHPPAEAALPPGAVPVTAPLAGIFYRAPAPGAPPFVEVGSPVAEGDRVGFIEVMKLFAPVVAPTSGVVREIRAKNEEFVHGGQVLVVVAPSER